MTRNPIRNEAGFPLAPAGSTDVGVVTGPVAALMVPRIGDEADLLPPLAADRLRDLRQQRDDAHVLITSVIEEMQNLRVEIEGHRARLRQLRGPRGSGGADLEPDDVRVLDEQQRLDRKLAELKRLNELNDLRGGRWSTLGRSVTNCEDWVRKSPLGSAIVMHPPIDAELKKGEDLLAGIERYRRRSRELEADLSRVAAAPHPSAARKEVMIREVEAWAEQGKPDAASSIEHGEPIGWPLAHHQFEIYNVGPGAIVFGQLVDIRAFMAWWDKEGMIKRLAAEIDAVSDDGAALSDEERQRKRAETSADLLAVQRQEAELIWRAMRDGAGIIPRSDIDPTALLGVTLVPAPLPAPDPNAGKAGWVVRVGP